MSSDFSIVGGIYLEKCEFPFWDAVFGSAGRAAHIIGSKYPLSLHSVTSEEFLKRLSYSLSDDSYKIEINVKKCDKGMSFEYLHAIGRPTFFPDLPEHKPIIFVENKNILRFGAMEFDAICKSEQLVYDPQNTYPDHHNKNGSTADRAVYVLNHIQARNMTGCQSLSKAAVEILSLENVDAVIIKRGPYGANLYQKDMDMMPIPAFPTPTVFKIGSGDVFSSVFAFYWMVKKKTIGESAIMASLATSLYVETRNSQFNSNDLENRRKNIEPFYIHEDDVNKIKHIYLAGPFFTISQRWMIEELVDFFHRERIPYFSPAHHAGVGNEVSLGIQDIDAIDSSKSMLGWIDEYDPGTLLEIGYARSKGIKTHLYRERPLGINNMMFSALDCDIYADISSAVYNSVWER